MTLASWLRGRTGADHGPARRRVAAAVRLRRLPSLRAALAAGEVSSEHAAAVTEAAVPTRMDAVAAAEDALVGLARAGRPLDVKVALRRLADAADPDGSGAGPLPGGGPDPRRELTLVRTIDGLWSLGGTLDPVTGELLATALEAADSPDPAGTPAHARRSPAQRRHDALHEILRRVLDAGDLPTVAGVKPHVLLIADAATLAGADDAAGFPPRLRFMGEVSPALARRIAREAKVTAVQTMGPWRVVAVGRTQRVLPSWLRGILEMVHRHCRGPDCDRPIAWTEAHHQQAWAAGGETDLNATIPLCKAHHDLVTDGGWTVAFDLDTGICIWTGPQGQTIQTHPSADPQL